MTRIGLEGGKISRGLYALSNLEALRNSPFSIGESDCLAERRKIDELLCLATDCSRCAEPSSRPLRCSFSLSFPRQTTWRQEREKKETNCHSVSRCSSLSLGCPSAHPCERPESSSCRPGPQYINAHIYTGCLESQGREVMRTLAVTYEETRARSPRHGSTPTIGILAIQL